MPFSQCHCFLKSQSTKGTDKNKQTCSVKKRLLLSIRNSLIVVWDFFLICPLIYYLNPSWALFFKGYLASDGLLPCREAEGRASESLPIRSWVGGRADSLPPVESAGFPGWACPACESAGWLGGEGDPQFPPTETGLPRSCFFSAPAAHQNRVTAIIFSLATEWVISTGHDKCVSWMCTRSGNMLGRHFFSSWASCLQYPSQSQQLALHLILNC